MPEPNEQPAARSAIKAAAGYVSGVLLLLMFILGLFGDLLVWAVWGTRFVLSPRFHQAEFWLNGLLAVSFFSFIGLDKGLQHFQQRRWKPFLIALLTFIVATMPFAKPFALLVRFATVKGVAALVQPKLTLPCWFSDTGISLQMQNNVQPVASPTVISATRNAADRGL